MVCTLLPSTRVSPECCTAPQKRRSLWQTTFSHLPSALYNRHAPHRIDDESESSFRVTVSTSSVLACSSKSTADASIRISTASISCTDLPFTERSCCSCASPASSKSTRAFTFCTRLAAPRKVLLAALDLSASSSIWMRALGPYVFCSASVSSARSSVCSAFQSMSRCICPFGTPATSLLAILCPILRLPSAGPWAWADCAGTCCVDGSCCWGSSGCCGSCCGSCCCGSCC
mmetsp:Transcript_45790/g.121031  ORF Transcript_45790/g.121031 Transcript_45790/m.121031 type:complete len:231 (-) Transcript_45790:32-724(-)